MSNASFEHEDGSIKILGEKGHVDWVESAVKACAGLKDPENDIQNLIVAARMAVEFKNNRWWSKLNDALEPFQNIKFDDVLSKFPQAREDG